MTQLLLTTDWHLGHRRMELLCGRPTDFEYQIMYHLQCERDRLVDDGNDVILVNLGDVALGKDGLSMMETFLKELSAEKWLVTGNHDRKSKTWFRNNGWSRVENSIEYGHVEPVLLTHTPAWSNPRELLNIHGHQHTTKPPQGLVGRILLSQEHMSYRPITLSALLELNTSPFWDGERFTEIP